MDFTQQAKDATQQAGAKREEIISTGPSAEYMKARIRVLTKQLIRSYGEILDVAYTPEAVPDTPEQPLTLVDTANKQLTVDVATTSMVRAAEELMVLTRTMKELWLFGGLDTLVADQSTEEKEKRRKLREDEGTVVEGLQEWLQKNGEKIYRAPVQQEDTMTSGD